MLSVLGACLAASCSSNDATAGDGGAADSAAGSGGASTGNGTTETTSSVGAGGLSVSMGSAAGTAASNVTGSTSASTTGGNSAQTADTETATTASVGSSSVSSGGATMGGATASGGTSGTASGGAGGTGGTGGMADCAGNALSLSANGTASDSDAAFAHVEVDMGSDLPVGNAERTIEFWAFIKSTDWVGEKNEVYYYGGSDNAGAFGLDFGTDPVTGSPSNHATLDPFTGGGFNDDSTNDLGIDSSTDQWVHIAMVWDANVLVTYVDGLPKITTMGSGVTALATAQSPLLIGCNSSNNQCFNGIFDEFRVWSVARSAGDILANYDKGLVGDEAGLVGYWKFDESSGTTTADSVTAAGHTVHPGTLTASTPADNPTFVMPPTPLALTCP